MNDSIIDFLCNTLDMHHNSVEYLINNAPDRYKVYKIPKRKAGEFRVIAQPTKELKLVQKLILDKILHGYMCNECATAYIKGKGIKDNLLPHLDSKFLLKMDFKDFFPSIKPKDFINGLKKCLGIELSREEQLVIAKLFFWRNKKTGSLELSIGAPSSPMISNFVMHEFDEAMQEFCMALSVNYTRYADDLCFSSIKPEQLKIVERYVLKLVKELISPKLTINSEKTVHVSKKQSRFVTGLVISNDGEISLGREKKRLYKSMVHRYVLGKLDKADQQKLCGFIAYANSVEPTYVMRLKKRYSPEVIEKLLHSKKEKYKFKGDNELESMELDLSLAISDYKIKNYERALVRLDDILGKEITYPDYRILNVYSHSYYLKIAILGSRKYGDLERSISILQEYKLFISDNSVTMLSIRYLVRAYISILRFSINLSGSYSSELYSELRELLKEYHQDFEVRRAGVSFNNYLVKLDLQD